MAQIVAMDFDGGGLYVLSTLYILEELFQKIKTKNTEIEHFYQIAHLMSGTSAGAIAALGLSKAENRNHPFFSSPGELMEYVRLKAQDIFPNTLSTRFKRKILGQPFGILGSHFDDKPFNATLKGIFGDKTYMSDLENYVMAAVTQTDPIDRMRFIKSWRAQGVNTSNSHIIQDKSQEDFLIWETIRASAAPKPFLERFKFTNKAGQEFWGIDGAFGGQNNSSAALQNETKGIFGFQCKNNTILPHDIVHISIGTTHKASKVRDPRKIMNNIIGALKDFQNATLNAAPNASIHTAKAQLQDQYIRIENNMASAPEDIRPRADFTNSSEEQIRRIIATAQYWCHNNDQVLEQIATKIASKPHRTKEQIQAETPQLAQNWAQDLADTLENSANLSDKNETALTCPTQPPPPEQPTADPI